jgi:hypothetical protein
MKSKEVLFDSEWLEQLHQSTCDKCRDVMTKKNSDYANPDHSQNVFANFEASRVFNIHPVMGLLLRVQDKLKRIESFVEKGSLAVNEESWADACDDVVNYMILCKGLLLKESLGVKSDD